MVWAFVAEIALNIASDIEEKHNFFVFIWEQLIKPTMQYEITGTIPDFEFQFDIIIIHEIFFIDIDLY